MNAFSTITVHTPRGTTSFSECFFSHRDCFQLHDLDRGRAVVERAVLGHTTVGRVTSTGHEISFAESRKFSLLVPLKGRAISEARGITFRADPGATLLFSPSRRRTMVTGQGGGAPYVGAPVLFPKHILIDAAERVGVSSAEMKSFEDLGARLDAKTGFQCGQLVELVRLLVDDLSASHTRGALKRNYTSWERLLAEKVVEALAETDSITLPMPPDQAVAKRYVHRAEEYIHAHYGDIETIAEVATVCGISVRTLETSFQRLKGTSPSKYLAHCRLEEARRMLLSKDGPRNVTEVALTCGLNHLGRFAAAYARRFGESPSATLRDR